MSMNKEKRAVHAREIRADGGTGRISGYAAVFDSPTNIGGMFDERIARGAFSRSIADGDDVRALIDHNPTMVLGRSKAGTLFMSEDERGLLVDIELPDTQLARDLRVSMERGDISQMSFGFYTRKDEWDNTGSTPMRTLRDVELFDVSVVTYPAYDDTSAAIRSFEQFQEQHASSAHIAARLRMKNGLFVRGVR